jgi:Kef-type K+ transport system membrane component KefB
VPAPDTRLERRRRNLGRVIVASAILEDTIGWIIVGIAFGLALSGTLDAWSVTKTILGTAAFLAVAAEINLVDDAALAAAEASRDSDGRRGRHYRASAGRARTRLQPCPS